MGKPNKNKQARQDATNDMRVTGFIPPRKCPPHDIETSYSTNWDGTAQWAKDRCKDCGRVIDLRQE